MADLTLLVTLLGKDALSGVVQGAEGSLGSFAGKAVAVGAAVTTALAGLGVAATKMAGDLQQSVANVSTIKPDIDTSAVFQSLNAMTTRIPQAAAQLGDSLYNVFSSIDTTQEGALAATEKFAKGAVAATTDAATFGTAIMGQLNAYKLGVEDIDHVSDVFFATVKNGVVTGAELATSLGPVTASAKAAGVGIDELGAFIAGVTKEGGPAAQNINNLNNLLMKFTTKDAQAAISDLGVKTKDAAGNFRPVVDVLTDLKPRLQGMTESARANALQAIFPDAQARQGAQTILSQLDNVKGFLEENRTAVGATEAAYQKMSSTWNSQVKLALNGLTAGLTDLGSLALPALTPLVSLLRQSIPGAFDAIRQTVAPVLQEFANVSVMAQNIVGDNGLAPLPALLSAVEIRLRELGQSDAANALHSTVDAIKGLPETLQSVLPAIEGVVAAFGSFAILNTVMPAAIGAFEALGAVVASEGGVMAGIVGLLGGPVTITIGVVAAAVGLLTAAWINNWGDIQGKTAAAWSFLEPILIGLRDTFVRVWDQVQQGAAQLWSVLQPILADAGQTLRDLASAVLPVLASAWDALSGALQPVVQWLAEHDAVANVLKGTLMVLGGVIVASAAPIIALVGALAAWQHRVEIVQGVHDALASFLESVWNGVTSTVQGALDAIGSAMASAWDAVTSTVLGAGQAILGAVLSVWNQIPEDIRSDLSLIVTTLVERFSEMVQGWLAHGQQIVATVQAYWALVSVVVQSGIDAAHAYLAMRWQAIHNQVNLVWAGITGTLEGAWQLILTKAGELWGQLTGKVTEPLNQTQAAVSGAGATFLTAAQGVGKAVVDGIVSGIRAGFNAVGEAAAGLARTALAWAKQAIDAHSPSRVFADEVGAPIAEGIADGIEESAGAVTDVLADLFNAAREDAVAALDIMQNALGATFEGNLSQIEKAQRAYNADVAQANTDLTRALEAEDRKYARRKQDLQEELGTATKDRAKQIQKDLQQLDEDHGRKREDIARQHGDKLIDLEVGLGERLANAERQQAADRGKALSEFASAFDRLTRDTESKAAEIGRKTSEALTAAFNEAGKARQDAIDKASQSIQDAVENLGLSRLIRARRDDFGDEQSNQARDRDRTREDLDRLKKNEDDAKKLKKDFADDTAELLRKRRLEDREREYQLNLDLQKAKTDDDKKALHERFDEATADLAHRRQLEDAERIYQQQQRAADLAARQNEEKAALQERRAREDADIAFRNQQKAAQQAFGDQLDNEALNRQIARTLTERDTRIREINTALDAKQAAILDQEKREREALAESYRNKVADLQQNLINKLPGLTGQAQTALSTFLDGVNAKVGDITDKIVSQVTAATTALGGLAGAAAGGERLFHAGDTLPSGYQTEGGDNVVNDRGEVRVWRGGELVHKERTDAGGGPGSYGWDWRTAATTAATIAAVNAGQAVTTAAAQAAGILSPGERLQNLDTGGYVAGGFGQPVPIIAHGGELVLNPRQQRALLGGAGGGEIDYDALAAAIVRAQAGMAVVIDGERVGRVARTQDRRYGRSNVTNGVGGIN